MIINRMICKSGLTNNPNKPLKSIDFVTVHCTGNYNATATAKNHAVYLNNGSGGTQASFHYCVDKSEIWQMFEDTQGCWHAGDSGTGTGNTTSIGIEVCVNDKSGFKQACLNAAWLVAELLKRHNLTIDRVVQHYKWNSKNCPYELRTGVWGVTWNDFINMVKSNMGIPSDTKYYRVQVGAFSVKSNADAILIKIKSAGFSDAFITPLDADKLYRVQIGAYSVKSNADAMLAKIKTTGYKEAFVKYN